MQGKAVPSLTLPGANPMSAEKKTDWLKLLAKILRDFAKIMKTRTAAPLTAYHDISRTQELVANSRRYNSRYIMVVAVLKNFSQQRRCHDPQRKIQETTNRVVDRMAFAGDSIVHSLVAELLEARHAYQM
jgi:replicative superfamily II helicase